MRRVSIFEKRNLSEFINSISNPRKRFLYQRSILNSRGLNSTQNLLWIRYGIPTVPIKWDSSTLSTRNNVVSLSVVKPCYLHKTPVLGLQ